MAAKSAENDEKSETSKLGVLVPNTVQDDNRALVKYQHDGSIRNKLGPGTTDRITLGLAMHFWQYPDELEKVAHSEYVDDPESFKQRIQRYQEEHLDDVLVVARKLLHKEGGTQAGATSGTTSDDRLVQGTPQLSDAPQDRTISESERQKARSEVKQELKELIDETVRDRVEIVQRQFKSEVDELEAEIEKLEDQVQSDSADA